MASAAASSDLARGSLVGHVDVSASCDGAIWISTVDDVRVTVDRTTTHRHPRQPVGSETCSRRTLVRGFGCPECCGYVCVSGGVRSLPLHGVHEDSIQTHTMQNLPAWPQMPSRTVSPTLDLPPFPLVVADAVLQAMAIAKARMVAVNFMLDSQRVWWLDSRLQRSGGRTKRKVRGREGRGEQPVRCLDLYLLSPLSLVTQPSAHDDTYLVPHLERGRRENAPERPRFSPRDTATARNCSD